MTESTIAVATYNVNHICKRPSNLQTLKTIESCKAHVVCLQEVNQDWKEFLEQSALLKEQYPYREYHVVSYNPWAGFACLSKYPIQTVDALPETDRGWYPAGRVVVSCPKGLGHHGASTKQTPLLQILIAHLRAPVVWTHKRNWYGSHADWISGFFSKQVKAKRLDEIQTFARQLDHDMPTVIVGDFNERRSGGCIKYLQEKHGFCNVSKNGALCNTWTWSCGVGGIPFLCFDYDYILYSKQHLQLSRQNNGGAKVGSCGGSDHRIVQASFVFRSETTITAHSTLSEEGITAIETNGSVTTKRD